MAKTKKLKENFKHKFSHRRDSRERKTDVKDGNEANKAIAMMHEKSPPSRHILETCF